MITRSKAKALAQQQNIKQDIKPEKKQEKQNNTELLEDIEKRR